MTPVFIGVGVGLGVVVPLLCLTALYAWKKQPEWKAIAERRKQALEAEAAEKRATAANQAAQAKLIEAQENKIRAEKQKADAEAAVATAQASKVAAEAEAKRKEATAKEAEVTALANAAADNAKAKLVEAEAAKVKVDADKALAEQRKANDEAQRAQAESDKARAEAQKAQAEVEKANAEMEKANAEMEKAQAETERQKVNADAQKVNADKQKAQADAQKAKADAQRAQAETDKAKAEADKAQAESDRVTKRASMFSRIMGGSSKVPSALSSADLLQTSPCLSSSPLTSAHLRSPPLTAAHLRSPPLTCTHLRSSPLITPISQVLPVHDSMDVVDLVREMAQPDYWEKTQAAESADGLAAIPLDRHGQNDVWAALEQLLRTDHMKLKAPGADRGACKHDRLKMVCAWRLENPVLWEDYLSGIGRVKRDVQIIRNAGVKAAGGDRPATAPIAASMPGKLNADVNEAILMHGTNAGVLINIILHGMNERFAGSSAGTAYGEGSYLAEDAGKNDQYTAVDASYDKSSELHKRLYSRRHRHPGNVFYIVVCRVVLGHHVRTTQSGKTAKSADTQKHVFARDGGNYRELATVPGVPVPVHHHSLLVDAISVGGRYREFIVFHSELIYPEYVIAYQRE